MSDLMPWMAPWSGRLLALILFVFGLWLTRQGRKRFYRDGRPRCPACSYELTGLSNREPITCPECGQISVDAASRFFKQQRWPIITTGIVIALALPIFAVARRVREFGWEYYLVYGPGYWLFPTIVEESKTISGYEIRIEKDRRDWNLGETAFVKRGSKTVFTIKGDHCSLWPDRYATSQTIRFGDDLNHNKISDVILCEDAGSAHNGHTYYVMELAAQAPQLLLKVDAPHELEEVRDIDGDGSFEIVVDDYTFAYWNTCFACSPVPKVIFATGAEGKYALAPEYMRAAPLSEAELARRAREIRKMMISNGKYNDGSPWLSRDAGLWSEMPELIYAGNSEQAYQLFDNAWPQDWSGKQEFLDNFREQLARSPFVSAIEALGHPKLHKPSSVVAASE